MKWRKTIAVLTAAALTMGMLAGCAGNTQKAGSDAETGNVKAAQAGETLAEGEETAAKGRYVEEELEVPWGDDASYVYSYPDAEGKLNVFMMEGEDGKVTEYSYDGNWNQADCGWINDIVNQGNTLYYIRHGEDGKLYALAVREEKAEEESSEDENADDELEPIPWHLYCHAKDGTEEIFLPFLSEEGQQRGVFYPFYMGITESGDFVFLNGGNDDVIVYGREDGKQKAALSKHETQASEDEMYLLEGDILATLAENETDIVFYDTQAGLEENRIEIGEQKRGCLAGGDGRYYLANEDGIFTFRTNGSIIEQVFDGSMGAMSSGSHYLIGFQAGGNEDFYAVYGSENRSETKICHYVYDAEALAVPAMTLNVYGLHEDSRIAEAVHVFQKEHPDVKVEYEYAYEEYDNGNPEDTIKALNTELLGGQGADVLVLDGLPSESYAEKGILADLSSFGEKLKSDGAVLEQLLEGSKKDGKLYSIPTGMSVPLMFGTEKLCSAMKSLDSLEDFLDSDEEAIVTGVNAYSMIAWMLFGLDYENLMDESGKVNQEDVVRILQLAKRIGDRNDAEWVQEMQKNWLEYRESYSYMSMNPFSLTSCESYYDTGCVGIRGDSALYTLAEICNIRKTLEMELKSIDGCYIPKGELGVNQSSEKKELAEAFIETALKDEVQTIAEVALPVRQESLDKLGEISESKSSISIGESSWDGKMHSYGYPSAEELKPYVEIFKNVEKPLIIDSTVQEAFLDAADRYFEDGLSEEEAAQEMARMVDTYMAE